MLHMSYQMAQLYKHDTVRIEIGKTCGAEGIGQITFFVSINIHIIIRKQNFEISKKSFFKSNLHTIG